MKNQIFRTAFAARTAAAISAMVLIGTAHPTSWTKLVAGALSHRAAFQSEDISQKQIPSLELDQADVREALRALFKNVSVSYSMAPEVQGSVTVSLRNVTFETALQNVLRQVDATYRIEGGVYEIIKRVEMTAPAMEARGSVPSASTLIVRRIKIRSADPAFIAAMIGVKGGSQAYTIAPERSTISKTASSSGGTGGSGQGGLGGGQSGGGSNGSSGFGSGSSGSGSGRS